MTDFPVLFQKQLEGMREGIQGYSFDKYELDIQELFIELISLHQLPSNEMSKGFLDLFSHFSVKNSGKLDCIIFSLVLWTIKTTSIAHGRLSRVLNIYRNLIFYFLTFVFQFLDIFAKFLKNAIFPRNSPQKIAKYS